MLKRFAPSLPPRVRLKDHTRLVLDHGCSEIVFRSTLLQNPSKVDPTSRYLVENRLPPAPAPPSNVNMPNSSLCPPFHIHLKEDETFHVISGTAKFLLLDQRRPYPHDDTTTTTTAGLTTRLATPGTTLTIPRGQSHTFRNASTTQPLHIEFGFSQPATTSNNSSPPPVVLPAEPTALNTKMHRFFLNTQLYRSDCSTHAIPRSLTQVLLFNHHADVALVPGWLLTLHRRARLRSLRTAIERIIAPALGRLMNVLGGVVLGKYMFGLEASYAEYYPYSHTHPHGQSKPKPPSARAENELTPKT